MSKAHLATLAAVALKLVALCDRKLIAELQEAYFFL